jgi:hypothetical protein
VSGSQTEGGPKKKLGGGGESSSATTRWTFSRAGNRRLGGGGLLWLGVGTRGGAKTSPADRHLGIFACPLHEQTTLRRRFLKEFKIKEINTNFTIKMKFNLPLGDLRYPSMNVKGVNQGKSGK